MTDEIIKQLAAATVLRAVKDYFGKKSNEKRRAQILKDLRSPWMDFFTNGSAAIVADKLEKNPDEIKKRLKRSTQNGK